MCDDGMLTYKRAHDGRVTEPMLQGGRTVATVSALEAAKKLLEGAPKESLAVVFSAQHSLEDNWALRELRPTRSGRRASTGPEWARGTRTRS